ncbi:MAG: Ig-like domain-containing protein [Candidatus Paceibacterota bacterium]|jgi:SH3-like domain-containing protein
MKKTRKEIKKGAKKFFASFLLVATLVWSLGLQFLVLVPAARAASTFTFSTQGMPTQMPGSPIPASSVATAMLRVGVTASQAGQTLTSVTVNFSGTGFGTSDLAAIATNNTSGVALYDDAGGGNTGMFGAGDAVVTLGGSPAWSSSSITLTPATPVALANGTETFFYVVIKTSGTIADDDRIIAAIPATTGVVTSDGNNGASTFTTNDLKADTAPATIVKATGASGSAAVNVRFSKSVQKSGGGSLVAASFTFIDNGTTGGHTISSVTHNPGMEFATVTLNGNLDSGDFADGGNGISTIAAANNAIVDMGGNVVGTLAVNLTNAPTITTTNIPSTTVGTVYNTTTPLVALEATGGATGTYTWAAADQYAIDVLASLSLTLVASGADGGKITGTVANAPGSYTIRIKVTDSAVDGEKMFQINVAPSGGGGIPGINMVTPGGGAKGSSPFTVTITGSNTHFTASSTVQFLLSGTSTNDTNATAGTVSSTGATNLSFPVTITADATDGSRDVRVTTGGEVVTMPNGFGVYSSSGSGLSLFVPSNNATNIPIPPNFNFGPSNNATFNSYRLTVNTASDFTGTTVWDYTFPKTASHCNASSCNVNYGAGQYLILTQPAPLNPNTAYYWRVKTYAELMSTITSANVGSLTALETTGTSGFTTVTAASDTMPPNIMHRPIFQAAASTNLDVIVRVMDNFANASSTPALSSKLYYCAGSGCTPTYVSDSNHNGSHLGGGFYRHVIPSATVGAANTIVRYYLEATDETNTQQMKDMSGNPFQLTSVTAGNSTNIMGNIKDSATPTPNNLAGAYIFAEGTGFLSAATGADGNFTIGAGKLFAGTYDLVAFKEGFADRMMNGIPAGASGINFQLGQGGGGGFGGDLTNPRIKWNGPMDGSTGIPGGDTNFKIFAAFNKEMSQTSITAAGNMTVNEVNMSTGELTNITSTKGAWAYYTTPPSAPLPPDSNLAVWSFTGGNTFGDNKNIAVKITPNVTDTAGNAIQGNQSDGSYVFFFTTGSTATFSGGVLQGGGTFGSGAFVPPHVNGVMPAPGSFDVPLNMKIVINFSDPMADDGGGYLLKNNVKLYTVSGTTETDVSSSAISTVSLDNAKMVSTVTLAAGYNSGTFAASTSYRLKVLGGAKAANGMTIAPPDQASFPMFMSDFKTGTTSDIIAPTVLGTYPDNGATAVPVNIGAISMSFSKDMDVSTITTSTVYVSIGSTAINGTMDYRGLDRQAYFIPKSVLNPNTTYTINVTTGVTGINGFAIATAVARNFTTGAADSSVPTVTFMNADDYAAAISFSEPMNSAKATDSLNWAASVINPSNYATVKYGTAVFDPAIAGTAVPLTSATFKYDSVTNTVMIEGLNLSVAAGQELYVALGTGAKDLSGTAMGGTGNSARATIQNSMTTKGALGPMAMGGSAFDNGGGFVPTNFSSSTFGFAPPIMVKPFNMMAGQTTIFGVDLPISSQIPAGGSIVLTFPSGFDVTNAKQDVNSPMRTDLNGPGTGAPTFKCATAGAPTGASCSGTLNADDTGTAQGGLAGDGVVVNTSARTVTIYLSAATNVTGFDFLRIDVASIKNSTVPKGFDTSGYTVDIKTKSADGSTVIESLTSQPFFIQSGGSNTLQGTITAGSANAGTMNVFLMSPMTGPMEAASATFSGGSAAYSFPNLPSGDYMLFTDQTITLDGADYLGKSMPEMVRVTSTPTTYDFTLTSASSGTAVTVNITGPANTPLDVFAGSSTGFRVKQITLNGGGSGSATLYLSDGQWFVGTGPQMPKGPMSGPPPTPNYLPPQPVNVNVSGATVTENNGTANDGTIAFTLTSSDKTIKGVVKDGSDKVIANAEVYGYSPTGGFGTHAQADSSGNFTLNVVDGSYVVGAFVPGMPSSKEVSVVVNSDTTKGGHATNYLYIDGASVGIAPATALTTFVLKLAKPDYTISGKVIDGTNVVQGASVYAYRTDGPGNANAMTDNSGNYTLYVSAGTWRAGSFLPQYGQLAEQTVTITTSSASNINFSPSLTGTGNFYTIQGRVYKDANGSSSYNNGEELSNVFVKLMGNGTFNETISGVDGTYSFKAPEGNGYVIKAFAPNIGELLPLASFNVAGNISNKDITVGATRTITFTFSSSVSEAFIEVFNNTGVGNKMRITNKTTATMSLPDGSYTVRVDVPGMPKSALTIAATDGNTTYNSSSELLTVNSDEGLTVTLPTLRTVSGTVTDGTNNLQNAWVEIGDPTTGVHFGTSTNASGAFSLQVVNSSSDYFVQAMKPGYVSDLANITVNTGVTDGNLASGTYTLAATSLTIQGQIKIGATGAANAFVRAEKQGGGFAGTQADTSGNYTLYVTAGSWKVYGVAEGYAEAAYTSNPIAITTASVTGKDITLTTQVTLSAPKSKPITPASGGTLEDTTAGVKITVPANALGSSTSAGNIQSKETNNVRQTSSSKPVKKYDSATGTYINAAKEIKASDSDGNPITNLNDSVTVEMTYSKAEMAATPSGSDASINTKAEADMLKMSYWDETNSNWVTLPSTITYKDASGTVMDSSTAGLTPSDTLSNVSTVLISAPTSHFSLYAPTSSTTGAPSTPSGLSATAASSSSINLSWTVTSGATSYDIYRSASSGGTFARIGSEPTVSSGSTTSYTDTGLSASTPYYYKITALNSSGESLPSSEVTATTSAAAAPAGGGGVSAPAITAVTGASISVAGGAASTAGAAVTLTLTATNATHMAISNTSNFDGVSWETFATSKGWTLTSGNGTKTVYAKFKDSAGVQSSVISDSITLGEAATPITETPTTETPAVSTPTTEPEGTLFKYSDSPKVYVVKNGNQVWIQTLEEFNAGGYKWSDVKVVSATVVKTVGSVTLLRAEGDNKVYVIHNNTRKHVKSAAEFNAAGYKWSDVKVVSVAELGTYAEGTPVEESTRVATITATTLRIRSVNSTTGKVLGFVKKNENYSVLEENNGWYKITTPSGKTGWILGSYTSVAGASATVEPAPSATGTLIITTKWLRVRSVNSTLGKTLAFTKEGETYDILGESGNWFKIKTAKGIEGWVSKDYAKKQ